MPLPPLIAHAHLGGVDGVGGDAFFVDPFLDGVDQGSRSVGDEGFRDGWNALGGWLARWCAGGGKRGCVGHLDNGNGSDDACEP